MGVETKKLNQSFALATIAPMKFIVALLIALLYGLLFVYTTPWIAADPITPVGSLPSPMLTLTQTDNGKSFVLPVNQTLIISLNENPTTGFQWAREPSPSSPLVLTDSQYVSAAKPGLVGGGGQRILTFQAQKTGTEKLQLKLWRAWEGEPSIIDRFAVTVEVQR